MQDGRGENGFNSFFFTIFNQCILLDQYSILTKNAVVFNKNIPREKRDHFY